MKLLRELVCILIVIFAVFVILKTLVVGHAKSAELSSKVTCAATYDQLINAGLPPASEDSKLKEMSEFAKATAAAMSDPTKSLMVQLRMKQLRQFVVASVVGHPSLTRKDSLRLVGETADVLAGLANDLADEKANLGCQEFGLYYKDQARLEYPLPDENTSVINWKNFGEMVKKQIIPGLAQAASISEMIAAAAQ